MVPLAAAEEGLGVGDETLFEAGGEDDGGERALATGRAERLPGSRPGRVDERFPGLLLFGERAGFGKEHGEDTARGEEGGDGEELPRRAALQVDTLGVALALHAEECAVEVEHMAAGAGQQDEGCGEAARGVRGVLGFDGELARGGLDAREDASGREERREGARGRSLVRGHPPQEPVVGLVGGGDLERNQHLALQVRGGGADRLAGELGSAGKQDEADSLHESAGGAGLREGRGGRTPVKSGFAASCAMKPSSAGGGGGAGPGPGPDSPAAGGGGFGGNRLFIGAVQLHAGHWRRGGSQRLRGHVTGSLGWPGDRPASDSA